MADPCAVVHQLLDAAGFSRDGSDVVGRACVRWANDPRQHGTGPEQLEFRAGVEMLQRLAAAAAPGTRPQVSVGVLARALELHADSTTRKDGVWVLRAEICKVAWQLASVPPPSIRDTLLSPEQFTVLLAATCVARREMLRDLWARVTEGSFLDKYFQLDRWRTSPSLPVRVLGVDDEEVVLVA